MSLLRVALRRLPHCYQTPTYARVGDAGLDLYAANTEPVPVEAGKFVRLPTGIALALPPGYMAFVQPRSGLAANHGVSLLNTPGLIDSGYRGEIQVLLINHGRVPFSVKRGDRIAQLVVLPVPQVELFEVESLDSTDRASGGFGSSGP